MESTAQIDDSYHFHQKLKLHFLKKLLLVLIALVGLIFLVLYILKLIEPTAAPENVLISNITDHQVTVSWTTKTPTRGEIIISEDGKFPLLPNFASKIYQDERDKTLGKDNFYTTHYLTIDSLPPNKTYQFLIYQGWKKMAKGSFTTGPTLESILSPNPIYGKVEVEKKPGLLIYLQVITGKEKSALLSTLTNSEGRWSLDLGNLRTKDLQLSYKLSSASAENIVVQSSTKAVKATTFFGKDKPWPDVRFKN